MDHDRIDSELDRLVEGLVRWAGSGALIIDHMARCSPHVPATDRAETFTRLLRETLGPLADRHAATDLAGAARVVADAVEEIGREIYLVDPSELAPSRAERRRQQRPPRR